MGKKASHGETENLCEEIIPLEETNHWCNVCRTSQARKITTGDRNKTQKETNLTVV